MKLWPIRRAYALDLVEGSSERLAQHTAKFMSNRGEVRLWLKYCRWPRIWKYDYRKLEYSRRYVEIGARILDSFIISSSGSQQTASNRAIAQLTSLGWRLVDVPFAIPAISNTLHLDGVHWQMRTQHDRYEELFDGAKSVQFCLRNHSTGFSLITGSMVRASRGDILRMSFGYAFDGDGVTADILQLDGLLREDSLGPTEEWLHSTTRGLSAPLRRLEITKSGRVRMRWSCIMAKGEEV